MGGKFPRVLSEFREGEAVLEEVHHRRFEEISKHTWKKSCEILHQRDRECPTPAGKETCSASLSAVLNSTSGCRHSNAPDMMAKLLSDC